MALEELPAVEIVGHEPTTVGNGDHPMRTMTRRAAGLVDPPWDADAVHEVQRLFNALAPEWHTRTSPERAAVVSDALDRGIGSARGGVAVEVGSGIGAYSGLLAERFDAVVSIDMASEMLRRAPAEVSQRVMADGSCIPVAAGSAGAVVLVNMFLFPEEVDRVLAPRGRLVWVNSSAENTPIHLTPTEVVDALPGAWTGVYSRAGAGLWAVLQRAEG